MGCCAEFNYYETIFIADILCLLGLTEQFIPEDGWKKDGTVLQSRIWLTDVGKQLFITNKIRKFIVESQHKQLIIKNRTEKRKILDEHGKFRNESVCVPVNYKLTEHVIRKIRFVERVNEALNMNHVVVQCDSPIELKIDTVNNLLLSNIKNEIDLEYIDFSTHNNIDKSKLLLNNDLTLYINNTSFDTYCNTSGSKHTIQDSHTNTTEAAIWPHYKYNNNITICNNSHMCCQINKDLIGVNKIEFEILNKNLKRIFSRDSWSAHGRFYGFHVNLPKILRKSIYINNSTSPLVSLDFSALHPT